MDYIFALTLLGSLASIIGAYIAIKQAIYARFHANKAREVREELLQHRDISEIAHIQAVCSKAKQSMSKYGPGAVTSRLHGISPESDAANVQECIELLSEHRSLFGPRNPNVSDIFRSDVVPLLEEFTRNPSAVSLKETGTPIYLKIVSLMHEIKNLLDKRRDAE
jgi:hypothetical protein